MRLKSGMNGLESDMHNKGYQGEAIEANLIKHIYPTGWPAAADNLVYPQVVLLNLFAAFNYHLQVMDPVKCGHQICQSLCGINGAPRATIWLQYTYLIQIREAERGRK